MAVSALMSLIYLFTATASDSSQTASEKSGKTLKTCIPYIRYLESTQYYLFVGKEAEILSMSINFEHFGMSDKMKEFDLKSSFRDYFQIIWSSRRVQSIKRQFLAFQEPDQ